MFAVFVKSVTKYFFFARYSNIIPYDKNRVILRTPISNCDYVNASWITHSLSRGSRTFIAAQGPLKETVRHFLQMILENKIKCVVMLTKLKEKSKGVCRYEKA